MKRPGFAHGVVVAAVLGFFASAVVATLTPFVGLGAVIRLVIPALALAYLLYLLSRSDERVGRVTTITLWSALAALSADSRRRGVAGALPLFLLRHSACPHGPRPQWPERLGVRLGDHTLGQRVSRHLVFFPGSVAVCCNSGVRRSGKEGRGRCFGEQREIRSREATGRRRASPDIQPINVF